VRNYLFDMLCFGRSRSATVFVHVYHAFVCNTDFYKVL